MCPRHCTCSRIKQSVVTESATCRSHHNCAVSLLHPPACSYTNKLGEAVTEPKIVINDLKLIAPGLNRRVAPRARAVAHQSSATRQ